MDNTFGCNTPGHGKRGPQRPKVKKMKGKSQKPGENATSPLRQSEAKRHAGAKVRSARPKSSNSSSESSKEFPIAGVGASAGGLEAFSELLRKLPAHPGLGLGLVTHLDPSHRSIL